MQQNMVNQPQIPHSCDPLFPRSFSTNAAVYSRSFLGTRQLPRSLLPKTFPVTLQMQSLNSFPRSWTVALKSCIMQLHWTGHSYRDGQEIMEIPPVPGDEGKPEHSYRGPEVKADTCGSMSTHHQRLCLLVFFIVLFALRQFQNEEATPAARINTAQRHGVDCTGWIAGGFSWNGDFRLWHLPMC